MATSAGELDGESRAATRFLAASVRRAAVGAGRCLAWYALRVFSPARLVVAGPSLPERSIIAVAWHEYNLLAFAAHRLLRRRPWVAFTPPGLRGAAAEGIVRGAGCLEPIPLPPDGAGNVSPALRKVVRALERGDDALIAPDGPSGPRRVPRPGTAFLARVSGAPVVPIGLAAWPTVRYPRWDQHVLPLPGASLAVVMGTPMPPPTKGATVAELGPILDELAAEAERLLRQRGAPAAARNSRTQSL